jgi:hypothetical protein
MGKVSAAAAVKMRAKKEEPRVNETKRGAVKKLEGGIGDAQQTAAAAGSAADKKSSEA